MIIHRMTMLTENDSSEHLLAKIISIQNLYIKIIDIKNSFTLHLFTLKFNHYESKA